MRIASAAHSEAELVTGMRSLYPDYREADFFLKYSARSTYSVNP